MLEAIFYARFHPERGPSVIHQYPPTCLLPHTEKSLVNFGDISSYVIAPYELCNRPLSICANGHRILGFPVSLEHPKYDRNRFTFNVCFVLSQDEDPKPWQTIVRKTANFFTGMEERNNLLQREEDLAGLKLAGEVDYPIKGIGILHDILSNVMREMNHYGETLVHVDSVNTLNLKKTAAAKVYSPVEAWHVPILIRALPKLDDWTWDLTLRRIHSHIDGINHVHRIASLADVDLKLTRRAVEELVYHDRVTLLDIFHFQAIYTTNNDLAHFVRDPDMQDECIKYITMEDDMNALDSSILTREAIIRLYTLLTPGQTLQEFHLANHDALSRVDIRRFVTYGTIKHFVRRVHKYALAVDQSSPVMAPTKNESLSSSAPHAPGENGSHRSEVTLDEAKVSKELDRAWRKAALSSGWATPPDQASKLNTKFMAAASGTVIHRISGDQDLCQSSSSAREVRAQQDGKLKSYLDGRNCLDRIGVELGLSEGRIVDRIKQGGFGDVTLFCR